MTCKNCKTEYSVNSEVCPNCGSTNTVGLPKWMYIGAAVSVIVIISFIFCLSKGIVFKDYINVSEETTQEEGSTTPTEANDSYVVEDDDFYENLPPKDPSGSQGNSGSSGGNASQGNSGSSGGNASQGNSGSSGSTASQGNSGSSGGSATTSSTATTTNPQKTEPSSKPTAPSQENPTEATNNSGKGQGKVQS